ncbi:hypothetical protein PIB30_038655 [Stylosanthes scabra]|uniref:Uncharacterized protein n=1 Tax=Stylosanthes scabra TaxID=79078 RepID=A0ABU6XEF1_9FABA|nr:hypothetical protein [Stylosanthes scabra]
MGVHNMRSAVLVAINWSARWCCSSALVRVIVPISAALAHYRKNWGEAAFFSLVSLFPESEDGLPGKMVERSTLILIVGGIKCSRKLSGYADFVTALRTLSFFFLFFFGLVVVLLHELLIVVFPLIALNWLQTSFG